jgi:putative salt-induced outer membrane protein YdiY
MMKRVLCVCSVLLMFAAAVSGDEIHLTDGSRLIGTAGAMDSDGLSFETSFAGAIKIDASKIAGIVTDQPMTVALASGDRVTGALQYDGAAGQRLTGTTFGDVPIDLSRVVAIWPAGATAPATAGATGGPAVEQMRAEHQADLEATRQRYETEMASLRDDAVRYTPKWTADLELGLNGQTGNTEEVNFDGRIHAKRATQVDRFMLFVEGHFGRQNSVRNTNEVKGGAKYEIDISERAFAYASTILEFDEFENLDLRSNVTVGLGYFFIRQDDQTLKGRVGAGYQHESFDDGSMEDQGILEIGVEYEKQFAPWLLFTHETTYYPALDGLDDYRIVSETAGVIPIANSDAWKLRVGMRNEYDAMPQPGIDNLDTYYFLNIVYHLIK